MIIKKGNNHVTYDRITKTGDYNLLYDAEKNDYEQNINLIKNNIIFSTDGERFIMKQNKNGEVIHTIKKYIPNILGNLDVKNKNDKNIKLGKLIKDISIENRVNNYDFYPYAPNKIVDFEEPTFNIFNGFKMDYEKDFKVNEKIIKPIIDHIDLLANYEKDSKEYILNYLARIIQVPERKTGICMVIMGEQGSGKTSFFEWFNHDIIGKDWTLTVNNNDNVFKNFNSELKNKLVTILDEAQLDGSYRKKADQLKSLITQLYIRIEYKGMDPIIMNDRNNYIILTNNDFPVKIEQSDRRFAVFNMSNDKVGNTEYFINLRKTFDDENVKKHFFHYLLERDISRFIPERDIPITQAKQELKQESAPSPVRFSMDIIKNGIKDPKNKEYKDIDDILNTGFNNETILDTEKLYESYKDFMFKKCPNERVLVENGFITQLNKLLNIKTSKKKGVRHTKINKNILKDAICNYFKVDNINDIFIKEFTYEKNENEINGIKEEIDSGIESDENINKNKCNKEECNEEVIYNNEYCLKHKFMKY